MENESGELLVDRFRVFARRWTSLCWRERIFSNFSNTSKNLFFPLKKPPEKKAIPNALKKDLMAWKNLSSRIKVFLANIWSRSDSFLLISLLPSSFESQSLQQIDETTQERRMFHWIQLKSQRTHFVEKIEQILIEFCDSVEHTIERSSPLRSFSIYVEWIHFQFLISLKAFLIFFQGWSNINRRRRLGLAQWCGYFA